MKERVEPPAPIPSVVASAALGLLLAALAMPVGRAHAQSTWARGGSPAPSWMTVGIERQVRLEQRLRPPAVARPDRSRPLVRAPDGSGGTTAGMVGAGLLGGALGFGAGFLGGFAVLQCDLEVPDGCVTAWLGATAITTGSGVTTGVHLANDSRGNWLPSAAATVGLAGLGYAVSHSAGSGIDGDNTLAAVAFSLTSVAQLVTAVAIERGTSEGGEGARDDPS